MSPALYFVLCMDKLSHPISQAVDEGRWIAPRAGRSGPIVSHLMFADDLLLFGQATNNQIMCVKDIMDNFCNMSGQEVSVGKTSI